MQAQPRPRRSGTAALTTSLTLTAVALLAACGTTSAGSDINTSLGPTGTVGAAHTPLGTVLVDSRGRTLYELDVDSTQHIVCVDACARTWPPYTVPAGAKPASGGGVEATLATVQRPDGTWQVTADGHPLYTFGGDRTAGQTTGQGVRDTGGTWDALAASGSPVTAPATPKSSKGPPGYAHY
jgi:predicted lipoprotein with Yx(FWY)xxD motif